MVRVMTACKPIEAAATLLDKWGVEYEQKANPPCLLLNRTSIVQQMRKSFEQGAYDVLRYRLNEALECEFSYTGKTDEWLMLEPLKRAP